MFLATYTLGLLVYNLSARSISNNLKFIYILVMGFITLNFFIMFWWYFFSISNNLFFILLLFSTYGLRDLFFKYKKSELKIKSYKQSVSLYLFMIFLFGLSSTQYPINHDSLNYHYPIITWISENPIAIGLGNLDEFYGLFSQIYFISALMDLHPLVLGSQIANGFVVIFAVAALLMIRKNHFNLVIKFYAEASIFIISLYAIFNSDFWFASPSPDLPAVAVTLLSLVLVLTGVIGKDIYLAKLGYYLSFIGYLFRPFLIIVSLALFIFLVLYRKKLLTKTRFLIININIVPAILILTTTISKFLATGFFFYPITIFSFNYVWRMEKEIAKNLSDGVNYWQQTTFGLQRSNLSQYSLDFFVKAFNSDYVFTLTFICILIFCFFLFVDRFFVSKGKKMHPVLGVVEILILIFFIAWNIMFFLAPQMRFLWPFNWALVSLIYSYIFFRIDELKYQKTGKSFQKTPILFSVIFLTLLVSPLFESHTNNFKFQNYLLPNIINFSEIKFLNKENYKDTLQSPSIKTINKNNFSYSRALIYCGYQSPPCSKNNLETLKLGKLGFYKIYYFE